MCDSLDDLGKSRCRPERPSRDCRSSSVGEARRRSFRRHPHVGIAHLAESVAVASSRTSATVTRRSRPTARSSSPGRPKRYDELARTELAPVPRGLLLRGKGVPRGAFGGIVTRLQLRGRGAARLVRHGPRLGQRRPLSATPPVAWARIEIARTPYMQRSPIAKQSQPAAWRTRKRSRQRARGVPAVRHRRF